LTSSFSVEDKMGDAVGYLKSGKNVAQQIMSKHLVEMSIKSLYLAPTEHGNVNNRLKLFMKDIFKPEEVPESPILCFPVSRTKVSKSAKRLLCTVISRQRLKTMECFQSMKYKKHLVTTSSKSARTLTSNEYILARNSVYRITTIVRSDGETFLTGLKYPVIAYTGLDHVFKVLPMSSLLEVIRPEEVQEIVTGVYLKKELFIMRIINRHI